ncbi:MAG: MazG nucleotide pyrophosphohydrolase domain-containing protein [bacterium]
MEISEFQKKIKDIYLEKDGARGAMGTFAWFVEEVGELSRAIRRGSAEEMEEEFSDVFAWLVSLATICGVDIEKAAGKYGAGCPKCGLTPCGCGEPNPR